MAHGAGPNAGVGQSRRELLSGVFQLLDERFWAALDVAEFSRFLSAGSQDHDRRISLDFELFLQLIVLLLGGVGKFKAAWKIDFDQHQLLRRVILELLRAEDFGIEFL